MQQIWLIGIGLLAGLLGGLFGVGGGVVMVPLLAWLLGKTQQQAQGISLAVILLPTALPAVLRYQRAGNLEILVALWVALGFVVGGWLGGGFAQMLPSADLRRWFGVFLVLAGLRFALFK